MPRTFNRALLWLTVVPLLLWPARALAHEGVVSGDFEFTIGWRDEPVLAGMPNSLDLMIVRRTDPAGPVLGAEASLTFEVRYGGVSQTYALQPTNQRGHYLAEFIPTREGQYTFAFLGEIDGQAIDIEFEPEEVQPVGRLAFPEPLSSASEITARLAAAEARAGTAQTIAAVAIVAGLVGAAAGIFGAVRKR